MVMLIPACTRPKHHVGIYCAISLKQQSTGRIVIPQRHTRLHNWLLATITHFLHQMLKYDKIFQYLSYNFLFKELGVMHVWYTIFSFIDRGN
jgi:hypothetical protein